MKRFLWTWTSIFSTERQSFVDLVLRDMSHSTAVAVLYLYGCCGRAFQGCPYDGSCPCKLGSATFGLESVDVIFFLHFFKTWLLSISQCCPSVELLNLITKYKGSKSPCSFQQRSLWRASAAFPAILGLWFRSIQSARPDWPRGAEGASRVGWSGAGDWVYDEHPCTASGKTTHISFYTYVIFFLTDLKK